MNDYWPHMWRMPNIFFMLISFKEGYENVVMNSIIANKKYFSYLVLKQINIISIFGSTKLVESSRRANILISVMVNPLVLKDIHNRSHIEILNEKNIIFHMNHYCYKYIF